MKPPTPTTYLLYIEHDSGPDRVGSTRRRGPRKWRAALRRRNCG